MNDLNNKHESTKDIQKREKDLHKINYIRRFSPLETVTTKLSNIEQNSSQR